MYRRYITILILTVSILFLFTGCNYVVYKHYYTKAEDYTEIWDLTGFVYAEKAASFFPKSIENSDVKEFFCRYDEQLPLGEGIQILLEIYYNDKTSFEAETERISSISTACDDLFENSSFFAYAVCIGQNSISNYALIDKDKQVIYYIYLQSLPKEEIEFEHQFLPVGYTGYGEVK